MIIERNLIFILLLLLLPIYFKNILGMTIAYVLVPFIIFKIIFNIKANYRSFLIWIPLYTLLSVIQIIFIEKIDLYTFIVKYLTIVSFVLFFYLSQQLYSKRYDKYIIFSLVISSIYGVYSAFSYILAYDNYLIPGTCEANNINNFGLLRCATFGEGNYFGNYLALISILFADRKKVLYLTFTMSLIAFSPIPIFLIFYLLSKKYINTVSYIFFIIIIVMILYYFIDHKNILATIESQTSSFGERLEFLLASLRMFFNNPVIGVGLGQYGFNLSNFTNYPHLIEASSNNIRFIPNNNFAELLSEQGVFGIFFYFFYLSSFLKGKIATVSNKITIFLIIAIGLAMPTLYLIFVAVISGCISSKMKKNI